MNTNHTEYKSWQVFVFLVWGRCTYMYASFGSVIDDKEILYFSKALFMSGKWHQNDALNMIIFMQVYLHQNHCFLLPAFWCCVISLIQQASWTVYNTFMRGKIYNKNELQSQNTSHLKCIVLSLRYLPTCCFPNPIKNNVSPLCTKILLDSASLHYSRSNCTVHYWSPVRTKTCCRVHLTAWCHHCVFVEMVGGHW